MNETKIIEAIKVFGTPVWEAARLKVYITAGFLGISTACSIVLLVWGIKWWNAEVEKDYRSKDKIVSGEAWFVLALGVGLGLALVLALLHQAILLGFATDLYVYKELLP